jgi:hypothetical protein
MLKVDFISLVELTPNLMKEKIVNPKFIGKVDKSIFANSKGKRPTYYYGGADGNVYAIYSKRENPSNAKSKFKYFILHIVFDFSYDYIREKVLKKVDGILKPIPKAILKLDKYNKRLIVIRMSSNLYTRREAEKHLCKYLILSDQSISRLDNTIN